MIYDDHLHLRSHTVPPRPHELAPILESAASRGVTVCVREHPPLPRDFRIGPYCDYDYGMNERETERFVSLFKELKAPMGLESDFIAGYESEIAEIIEQMLGMARSAGVEITGVHGSAHLLPGRVRDVDYDKGAVRLVMWDLNEQVFIAHLKDRGPAQLLQDYFGTIRQLVRSRMFDALSHIDLIRKFDRLNDSRASVYFGDVEALYKKLSFEIVDEVAATGMAMEINTAGVCNLLGRPYISQTTLNYAVECGVPICLGSDAHAPERVGANFDIAVRMLEEAGADGAVTFKDRKAVKYSPSMPETTNCCDKGCRS